MEDQLVQAREHFIQGMSRISQFWGFSRAMGAIYGAISPRMRYRSTNWLNRLG